MIRKILVAILISIAGLLATGIILVHFDTALAAQLTDNVLRPILGESVVIPVEQSYYNFTDSVSRATFHPGTDVVPIYTPEQQITDSQVISKSNLDVTPILDGYFPTQKGENDWVVRQLSAFPNQAVMAHTFVRPDPLRPYSVVTVVQIDTKKVRLGIVAGTKQPGGPVGMIGPGVVPEEIINSGSLIAAFDGGFQYRDGQYGMVVGDTTYLPLKSDLATLIGYNDGSLKIIDYQGENLGNNVTFVRQNCPPLIENGQIVANDEKNRKFWGRTMTTSIFTWRSGIGINKQGNLLFAVGNSLTPFSLATALKMAGAVSGMQLDINPYWVRFNIFDYKNNGVYQTSTLLKNIQDGSKEYLHGYTKDFFYIYKK